MTTQTLKAREDLEGTIKGSILVPDDPAYEETRQVWNAMIVPHGVTSCITLLNSMRFMAEMAAGRFGRIAEGYKIPFDSDNPKAAALACADRGFTYLDPVQFHDYFAADLSAEQAAFMARSQVFNAADNFKAVITTAAWRSKPSWMLVATKDRTINPDLERWYAERAKSHKVEVSGASHAVYASGPKDVAALIEEAATHAQ
jgi:pimeloyl-ACP methyl ester carboxylesterase